MVNKVFIASKPTSHGGRQFMDFSSAEEYGDLVEILPAGADVTRRAPEIATELEARIKELQPQPTDFLILTGNPIVLALTVLFWAEHTTQFNFLQFDKTIRGYKLITLDLSLPEAQ